MTIWPRKARKCSTLLYLSAPSFEEDCLIRPLCSLISTGSTCPVPLLSANSSSPSPALSGLFTGSVTHEQLSLTGREAFEVCSNQHRSCTEAAAGGGVSCANANVTNMKMDYYCIWSSTLGVCTRLKIAPVPELLIWTAIVPAFEESCCFVLICLICWTWSLGLLSVQSCLTIAFPDPPSIRDSWVPAVRVNCWSRVAQRLAFQSLCVFCDWHLSSSLNHSEHLLIMSDSLLKFIGADLSAAWLLCKHWMSLSWSFAVSSTNTSRHPRLEMLWPCRLSLCFYPLQKRWDEVRKRRVIRRSKVRQRKKRNGEGM